MVDWITVVASVGLSVAGSLAVTEYQLRREQSVEASAELQDWRDEAAGYASEVRRTWQRLFDTPERVSLNLSELQGEHSLLEGQISRHASTGEQLDADQEVIEALDELAQQCRNVEQHHLGSNSLEEFEELRNEALDAVEEVESALDES